MDDPNIPPERRARGFPFVTVAVTLATLCAFLGLMVLVYRSPNYLEERRDDGEPKPDPATRLTDVRTKNQAILAGSGAKMSEAAATAELLDRVQKEGKLPFPLPQPPPPPVIEPKKK
jgi:hypothetical protein